MTSNSEPEVDNKPSLEYVPIAGYQLPSAPITHSARERLASLRRLFRRGTPEQDSPLWANDKLLSLPQCQLERIAPTPDWEKSANVLNRAIDDWVKQENPDFPVIITVGPPHSGNAKTLMAWAKLQSWRTLERPSPEQILAGDESWINELRGDGSPWVFPALEKVYLRHAEGLKLLRVFLDHVCSGKIGRGIIACDSWAWAYLSHLWRGRTPTTLSLQALDQPRLTRYFQDLVLPTRTSKLFFRQSDNGHYVLPSNDSEVPDEENSNFLQIIAAHSRGIPGVALAVWRASMQAAPEESNSKAEDNKDITHPYQTIWILPWNQLKLPSLPIAAGCDEAFVLQTLLLHNGLTFDVLKQLLPMPPNQVLETIYRLEEDELVNQEDTVWQVTARGYPAVRQFLATNNYLVDQF